MSVIIYREQDFPFKGDFDYVTKDKEGEEVTHTISLQLTEAQLAKFDMSDKKAADAMNNATPETIAKSIMTPSQIKELKKNTNNSYQYNTILTNIAGHIMGFFESADGGKRHLCSEFYTHNEEVWALNKINISGVEYELDTSFKTVYDIVISDYSLDDVFYKLVKINRYVEPADMMQIVRLIFDSFKTAYTPEKDENEGGEGVTTSSQSISYKQDYSMIWDTFKTHRNVDLNKDDISWIEFQNMLQGVLLEGVGSLCKVLEFRAYKKPPEGKNAGKIMEQKQHAYRMEMKTMYRIRKSDEEIAKDLNAGFGRMFDILAGMAKNSH